MARKFIWLVALVALVAVGVSGSALAKGGKKTSGVVYAGITHQDGNDLIVAGDINDKLLGKGAIVYFTQPTGSDAGIHVEASQITIYTTKGSLTGKGAADQTVNSDGTSTISNGTFSLTKGTGAYKGHTLKGTFDGTQGADSVYKFDYTGTYK